MPGAALEALAVEAVVSRLEAEVWMAKVCEEWHCLEGQEVWELKMLAVWPPHLQPRLPLGCTSHHGLGTWTTWRLVATPAVQRSKSRRVTNAKATIQI